MRPEDLKLYGKVNDVRFSPDGQSVAWVEISLNLDKDTSAMVIKMAPSDGSHEPREFTHGPREFSPRFSPDGRYLAFLAATDGPPAAFLAPLDGGVPLRVCAPGPVAEIAWSPDASRLALVVATGLTEPAPSDPKAGNAPRVITGAFNRLDGGGFLEGHTHLFVYDPADQSVRQITRGNYNHVNPSWSPDGSTIAYVTDRSRQRHDTLGRGEIWKVSIDGGRPERVTGVLRDVEMPSFSPDGRRIVFTGVAHQHDWAGRDPHLLVVDASGGDPTVIAPAFDRPSYAVRPAAWLSNSEVAFVALSQGSAVVARTRIGQRGASIVAGGDTQIESFDVHAARGVRRLAVCSAWVDDPGDVYVMSLDEPDAARVRLSRSSDVIRNEITLAPARRRVIKSHDGLPVEYFVMEPPRDSPGRRQGKPPLYLHIHGGPNAYSPLASSLPFYQSLVAAGYAVILPNPRGSIGYGEEFAHRVVGDWGGEDYHDLMACVDDMVRRGRVDERRLFVGGYSYGGYMSSWIVGQTNRFKAAIVGAPVTNLISEFTSSDISTLLGDIAGGDPWRDREMFLERSPVSHINKVSTPVFIHVSEGDLRTPTGQSDELFVSLRFLGKEVEYVRYPGGSHGAVSTLVGPPSQNVDRVGRILDFLARHGGIRVKGAERTRDHASG
jgi:dipeptidyl aminopeptidase/acylaminoacyl peptidase